MLAGLAALVMTVAPGCELELEDISVIVERDRDWHDDGWFGFDVFVEDDCCRDEYYYEEYFWEEWWP
ncbi:MAG: hypothetical protein C4547_10070 [Phycisphaerales bacterium]|nr:MAG: hypothetical protein C4547_10070 [Phycisphaerales bacterium]